MAMSKFKQTIYKTIRKNKDDFTALLTGSYPSFIYRNTPEFDKTIIPVFTFHCMEPEYFEKQLQFLALNNYCTLTANELEECISGTRIAGDKSIALTFDDCRGSLWATASPLMQKYGFNGIAFIIAGVVEEGDSLGPTMHDVWKGDCSMEKIKLRDKENPLCNWKEIKAMSDMGVFEFHSHSMLHNSIFVSNEIIDFINPGLYPSFLYSDFNPIFTLGDGEATEWSIGESCLGQPVYKYEASYASKTRFIPNPELGSACHDHIQKIGASVFFRHYDWNKELTNIVTKKIKEGKVEGYFQTIEERFEELCNDLSQSKSVIEKKLNKPVNHLCFPWFKGSAFAVKVAKHCGFTSCHWGFIEGCTINHTGDNPYYIKRMNDEYIFSLPGSGRKPLISLLLDKAGRIISNRLNA